MANSKIGVDHAMERRRLLQLGGAAAAGVAGAAVGSSLVGGPAAATTGAMQFGTVNDAGTDLTGLVSSNADATLVLKNSSAGLALRTAGPVQLQGGFKGPEPWIDVTAWGAKPSNNELDAATNSQAIQAAINSLPSTGGTIYFPPGAYWVADQTLFPGRQPFTAAFALKYDDTKKIFRDNVCVCGSPGGGSIIKRDCKTQRHFVFIMEGVQQIRVEDLTFQLFFDPKAVAVTDPNNPDFGNYAFNFSIAVEALPRVIAPVRQAADISVERCTFEAIGTPPTNAPKGAMTLMAVLAEGVRNLRVCDNRVDHMQIKLDGGGTLFPTVGPTRIAGNYSTNALNLGISAVTGTPQTQFVDLSIVGNVIQDPHGVGGIDIGADGEQSQIAALRRVHVCDNIITGNWSNPAPSQVIGVYITAAVDTDQVLVADNLIDNGLVVPGLDTWGMMLRAGKGQTDTGATTVRGVIVRDNIIRNMNKMGILVKDSTDFADSLFTGNLISSTTPTGTGLVLSALGSMANVTVVDNVTASLEDGIAVLPNTGQTIGPITLRDNLCLGCAASGIKLDAQTTSNSKIIALVTGNRCTNNTTGITELGTAAALTTMYTHNDLTGNGSPAQLVSNPYLRENFGLRRESALDALAPARFNRSGLLTIPAGTNNALTTAVPGGLTASSHVLATMQTATSTNIGVKSATPNPSTGQIAITLTTNAPSGGIVVAWLVFG
jgi:hypothetical protein